jgi:glucose/arabinose dehydrogenase
MKFYLLPKFDGSKLPSSWFFVPVLMLMGAISLSAQPEISINTIATGFDSPVDITHAGDDRLFIVEQDGAIKIIDADHQVLSTPFLDIDPIVGSGGNEQGLLGLAFHPDYSENGYFYVSYNKTNGDSRVSRFSVSDSDPNVADPDSEVMLLEIDQPYSNHNGGGVKFGPDGYLYLGFGDGGSGGDPQGNGQNRLTFLGKMLRIDVDNGDPYSVPDTNPFAFDDFTLDEIWAIGVRNPWRFSFDRLTGDLWIADVGQNAWEEIDFQPSTSTGGENYGWRCFEGFATYDNDPNECPDESQLTAPIHVYSNNFSTGCSVTGGFVYRGEAFPQLYGHYLYTDFCSGRIWSITKDDAGAWENVELLNSTNNEYSSFGEDLAGELYLAGRSTGKIYQIEELCASYAVSGEVDNESCEGDANGSIALDIENGTAPYQISWSNGLSQSTIFNLASGSYSVTVLDDNGCERSQDFEVVNGTPVAPVIGTVDNVLSVPNIFTGYQWLLNGEAVEGATEAVFEASETGSYSLVVTSVEGCTAETNPVGVVVNSLEELGLNKITLGPNPFIDDINIKINTKKGGSYQLVIRDLKGSVVFESTESMGTVFDKTLSLKAIPAGTYLFSIERKGKEIVRKITKQ